MSRFLYLIGYPLFLLLYRVYNNVSSALKKIQNLNNIQDLKYTDRFKKLNELWHTEIPIQKISSHLKKSLNKIQIALDKFQTKKIFLKKLELISKKRINNNKPSPELDAVVIKKSYHSIKTSILLNIKQLAENETLRQFPRYFSVIKVNVYKITKKYFAKTKNAFSSAKFTATESIRTLHYFSSQIYEYLKDKASTVDVKKHQHEAQQFWVNIYKNGRKNIYKTKNIPLPKFKWVARGMFALLILFSTALIIFGFAILRDLPSPEVLGARQVKASTKIYDRNGVLLYKIYKDQNRTPVPLSKIPVQVKNATLAIEDSDFYSHPGFSLKGISRAIIRNYQRGELTGGSTITQQLVKNALLTSEKTLTRKIKEVVLAVQVEMQYDKDNILEMYLNEVSYGGTAYGIQEAAKMYFDKNVDELTLAEAALLAGLPKSPSQHSPFGSNPDAAKNRQKEVLRLMVENNYITQKQKEIAEQERLVYANNQIDIKAPHFVMYVREILEQKYGREMVEQGGLEVYTTLDYEVQQHAENIVREEVENLTRLNVGNGAAVILSPTSGEILAMVGSRDYFDVEHDGNVNVTTSLRQPGSSIKIVNYAYALSHGSTPATLVDDSPATFLVNGSPPYQPKNYDGKYRGRLTIRSALAESRNVPAVKILNSYGVENMIELGKEMGISTWEDKNRFGLSLTLGGGEVKLVDLAQVYATVANYGKRPNIVSILKVTDYKGNVLDVYECDASGNSTLVAMADKFSTEVQASDSAVKIPFINPSCDGKQILDPRVAFMITDILKDNDARSPAFGRNSLLNIPAHKEVAVKTGTSNDLRDNLTVGYNQNFLVAVWVGNNDNTPMSRVASGITGASPIFNKIMTYLVQDYGNHDWEVPEGMVQLPICEYTGTLACSGCPTKMEWFLEENQPTQRCSEEWFRELRRRVNDDDDDNNDGNDDNRRRNNRIPEWLRERFGD